MYHFEYVTKEELSPVKMKLTSIITSVQDLIRPNFTFRYDFVGSAKQNMVTYDRKTNIGFDFDVNIQVNDDACHFSPKEIKTKIKNALDEAAPRFGYDYAEDSTRVLTIKLKDRQNSRILHNCDFAVVDDYVDDDGNGRQKYIRFNKKSNRYTWAGQPKGYYLLDEKADWIKHNGHWDEMKKLYLYKKNCNNDCNKHSRSIYAETIHQICQQYGYYDEP